MYIFEVPIIENILNIYVQPIGLLNLKKNEQIETWENDK